MNKANSISHMTANVNTKKQYTRNFRLLPFKVFWKISEIRLKPGFLYWDQAAIPLKSICWHLPELLALMPAAGFSSPTNVDFHKCRHIQMSPHLLGYIHPQSHNSLVKNRIYDNQKSFKHSQVWAKLSLNLCKHLQNAASHNAREMEVPPLLTKCQRRQRP